MDTRRGFTVIELLVVTVLGSMILLATYNVIITNQRTYTANTANIQGQQTVRAGMDLLFSELREISPSGGDLMKMKSDTVTIRVMRAAGIICDSVPLGQSGLASNPPWRVIYWGDTVATGDSAWVYDDNAIEDPNDDSWFQVRITHRENDGNCGGRDTQALRFVGTTMLAADTPTVGSLVRTYQTYTYALGTYDGETYLTRKLEPSGTAAPVVGPLMSAGGLAFQFLDSDGNVTAIAADVRQVVVTLKTRHEARDEAGAQIVDSLKTRIYTRN